MVAVWGTLSDKISTRPVRSIHTYLTQVTTLAYLLVGGSLIAFVHPSKVYPDLIFLRLFFALGGSASVSMVTAILPQLTPHGPSSTGKPSNGKLAGLAGLSTGVGALIAVLVFLPLPRTFLSHGWELKSAVQSSFYVVSVVAFLVSLFMYLGLKPDPTKSLFRRKSAEVPASKTYLRLMAAGFLAAKDTRILLAYIGGLLARADSIVISLFIPTVVNHYFVSSDLCSIDPHAPSSDIKEVHPPRRRRLK
jgi:MFS family permease